MCTREDTWERKKNILINEAITSRSSTEMNRLTTETINNVKNKILATW